MSADIARPGRCWSERELAWACSTSPRLLRPLLDRMVHLDAHLTREELPAEPHSATGPTTVCRLTAKGRLELGAELGIGGEC